MNSPLHYRSHLCTLLAASALVACATEPPPPPPRAHHHHHHHVVDDGTAAAQSGASTDTVAAAGVGSSGGAAPVDNGTPSANTAPTAQASATEPATGGATAASAPAAADGSADPNVRAAVFGTPAVATPSTETPLEPQWRVVEGRGRIVCEGATEHAPAYCPQCPAEPTNAVTVRTFLPFEQQVLQCEPPANEFGRLPIRAVFNGAGQPVEISFPGVHVRRRVAQCMGAALCQMRTPTFRAAVATVNYEYVVLLPSEPAPQ